MLQKKTRNPDARGQAGPSPALSGASPAPMEMELQEAELHQFIAEEDRLIDSRSRRGGGEGRGNVCGGKKDKEEVGEGRRKGG